MWTILFSSMMSSISIIPLILPLSNMHNSSEMHIKKINATLHKINHIHSRSTSQPCQQCNCPTRTTPPQRYNQTSPKPPSTLANRAHTTQAKTASNGQAAAFPNCVKTFNKHTEGIKTSLSLLPLIAVMHILSLQPQSVLFSYMPKSAVQMFVQSKSLKSKASMQSFQAEGKGISPNPSISNSSWRCGCFLLTKL